MFWRDTNLVDQQNGELRIKTLSRIQEKPPLHVKGEPQFWTDPHIATQMLKSHLDPEADGASYRPDKIDRIVRWLVDRLELDEDHRIIDLGCGPGLYTCRLAKLGLNVSGMDFSQNSLDYAREYADEHELDIEYVLQDYLTMDFSNAYDVITLISCDLGPLSDKDRDELLSRVHRALKPGGAFVFDVLTRLGRERSSRTPGWGAYNSGFWSPNPHLVLTSVYDYPEEDVGLDQYVVIQADGAIKVYRVWTHHYSKDTLVPVLEAHGFHVEEVLGNLTGEALSPESETLAVIARKP